MKTLTDADRTAAPASVKARRPDHALNDVRVKLRSGCRAPSRYKNGADATEGAVGTCWAVDEATKTAMVEFDSAGLCIAKLETLTTEEDVEDIFQPMVAAVVGAADTLARLRRTDPRALASFADMDALGQPRRDGETVGQLLARVEAE